MLSSNLLTLLGASQVTFAFGLKDLRAIFSEPRIAGPVAKAHIVDEQVLAALEAFPDPVDALVALRPGIAEELAEPRLLHVFEENRPQWMTEGDKMRLRRLGKRFMDITDHEAFYAEMQTAQVADKAHLPELTHQSLVRRLFPKISTGNMHDLLKHMTNFYNRYFGDTYGEQSSVWLHNHIAEIIDRAPFHTHVSLEYFTHPFPQSSIIARFEPKVRNATAPLTIVGAHQDSANYFFPLLPAPGADDDCSGTASIMEAFRVLVESGYTPQNGPVEFHWYAAEEGGLLGSQRVARYKREQQARIGAMMEFDMTAFVAKNATESMVFITSEADPALTNWTISLSKEYIDLPVLTGSMERQGGSDYMSFTKQGYPAAFTTEGDPQHNGFPGDFDPYIHTTEDTMDIDDERGVFSLNHMARFSELAIAFVVEQAGWDNKWRPDPEDDEDSIPSFEL